MRRPLSALFAFCCLALLALASTACDKPARPHPQGPGITPAAAATTVAQVPKVSAEFKDSQLTPEQRAIVIATIGTTTITLGELEARLAQESPVVRSQHASVQKRKDYLQKLVQFEVLAAEARRRGLDNHPDVVEQLRQAMVRQFLLEAVEGDMKPEQVTEADLRAYYDSNPALYHKPEQVEVSHILVADKLQADKIATELRTGSDGNTARLVTLWNDYVVRLSDDKATAPYLGALGLLSLAPPPGATPAELERLKNVPQVLIDTAFACKPMEVCGVVQGPTGWHVLMVTSRSPAVERSFDEAKDSIRPRIVKRERELRRQKLLDDLRAAAKVEVNADAVRLIPNPPIDRGEPTIGGAKSRSGAQAEVAAPGQEAAPAPTPTAP